MANRYDAQIRVQTIGSRGQKLINSSKVLIIGVGGLGTPAATCLAAAGVGQITLVDGDVVSLSNLHRQWLYTTEDIGKNKAETLRQKLGVINPEVTISAVNDMLGSHNAKDLIADHDVICDCTDNIATRLLIDNMCSIIHKPLVYAAVADWIGYLAILNHKKRVRLTDIFSENVMNEQANMDCVVNGIVNTTCGVLGSMQAGETLKIITGQDLTLDGAILCVDTLRNTQKVFKLS